MPTATSEDTQGKLKFQDARSRSRLLYIAIVSGLCAGFVAGQYTYLWWHSPAHRQSSGQAVSLRSLSAADQGLSAALPPSALRDILQKVAPAMNGRPQEVLIAISNYNLVRGGHLPIWLEGVRKARVTNYLVVAIDSELRDYLVENNFNVYYRDTSIDKVHEGTGDNHAISALKFKIILEFLQLGWNVLLSDVDIVVTTNPFDHLYRDHDVEAMSDGFDDATAYGRVSGLDDASMGWARFAQGTEHLNLNSGCFYLVANARTRSLMDRVASRLKIERAWDQSVFNQEIFYLAHGPYTAPNVTVRVMDIYTFMNSKVLFKIVRHQPRGRQPKPVMVHANYHPDKLERMRAIVDYYIKGDVHALEPFPGGSEPGS